MRTFIPRLKDRLGVAISSQYCFKAGGTAIPANQSILMVYWGKRTGALQYILQMNNTPSNFIIKGWSGATINLLLYTSNAAGNQTATLGPVNYGPDMCIAALVDRANTKLRGFVDGVMTCDTALTNDPDFSVSTALYNSSGGASDKPQVAWRYLWLSLTSVPTDDQWSEIMRSMRNPDAPIDPLLLSKVGALYSDYRPGEGVYGSTTITDNGTSGNTLTWQGATKVETVRTRQRVPWRKTKKTWYGLKAAYTANTGDVDLGFAVQSVIVRIVGKTSLYNGSYNIRLQNAATTHMITPVTNSVSLQCYCVVKVAGASSVLYWGANAWPIGGLDYEDMFIVLNGTAASLYINGQLVDTETLAAPIDLTGSCNVLFNGATGPCSRIAVWNPATVPATLEQEIRDCVCNPEKDPPSLTNCRADFALNSDTLPLTTSTNVTNAGLGGGTLVLSAQRSTSCANFLIPGSAT